MGGVVVRGVRTPLRTLPLRYWEPEAPSAQAVTRKMSAVLASEVRAAPEIPRATVYEIKRRQSGAHVYAVQRALNTIENPTWDALAEDYWFGAKTEGAVMEFQRAHSLGPDGVVGGNTSAKMADLIVAAIARRTIPVGLREGIMEGESSRLMGAVNWTVPGGVDCSVVQRRVYEGDYGNAEIVETAFDGRAQLQRLSRELKSRHDAFYGSTGAPNHRAAWRLATLNHNYPSAAAKIAEVGIGGLSSYYKTPQDWVLAIRARFPDGWPVRTPLDWCRHYSLGWPRHDEPGMMCKLVVAWR